MESDQVRMPVPRPTLPRAHAADVSGLLEATALLTQTLLGGLQGLLRLGRAIGVSHQGDAWDW